MREAIRRAVEDGLLKSGVSRADAATDTGLFARDLEQILTGNFDIEYPENKGTLLFPVDTSLDPGAETFTYRQYDIKGSADRITNWTSDLPSVTVKGSEFTAGVNSFGAAYSYSIQDLRAAKYAQRPLDAMKANAVRRVIANRVEGLIATGWADSVATGYVNPIYGMLNAPNVPIVFAARSVNDATGVVTLQGTLATTSPWPVLFATASPEQIAATFDACASKVSNDTKGVHSVDSVVLPLSSYNTLASRKWSPTYSKDSVLNAILESSAYIKSIESWNQCETAGTSAAKRALFYRKDPTLARVMLPVAFEQFAPEYENLAWTINCHMRCGGSFVPFPLSMLYLDGF